jgi:uncharacterized protein
MTLREKSWSPYVAGVLIGLLQIPAFLLMETALGTSSSYVTLAAHLAALADASIGKMDYLAKHMYGAKNLWQVAMVIGIAIGAYLSMKASGARRQTISPVWKKAVGLDSLSSRAPLAFAGGFIMSWAPALPTAAPPATAFPAWRSLRSALPSPSPRCLPVRSQLRS